MAKVENKCTNCRYQDVCRLAAKCSVVVWKHCEKFKPSLVAMEEAAARERYERSRRIFGRIK